MEQVLQGRRLGPEERALVGYWLATEPTWNRTRLSRELCRRWNWRNEAGRLKDIACRTLLLSSWRYENAFITDWTITDENVAALVATGRARWKIENENNNTLKTKGYPLEHNFGHGKKHLSSLLAAMNRLALLCHTFLAFCDESYRLIRATLPTRKTFFDDIRALLRYHCFPSWEAMLDFDAVWRLAPPLWHPKTPNRHPRSYCALLP